jgi:hypothetical protein
MPPRCRSIPGSPAPHPVTTGHLRDPPPVGADAAPGLESRRFPVQRSLHPLAGSLSVVGNPDLTPAQSVSWEVGVDQPLLGSRALLSATYFANTFTELMTFVSGPGPNFLKIQGAESSGVETGFQVLLP